VKGDVFKWIKVFCFFFSKKKAFLSGHAEGARFARHEESKAFFFEKKKQKTFIP